VQGQTGALRGCLTLAACSNEHATRSGAFLTVHVQTNTRRSPAVASRGAGRFVLPCPITKARSTANVVRRRAFSGARCSFERCCFREAKKQSFVHLTIHGLGGNLVLYEKPTVSRYGKIMKKQLLLLFRRVVPSKRNRGANGNGADNKGYRPPQIQWPYVMTSSVPMLGPIVQGSWIWHHHHRRRHHGYYRTRR
jgi:hypothetical protein